MQCHIVNNTLLRIAFSAIFAGWVISISVNGFYKKYIQINLYFFYCFRGNNCFEHLNRFIVRRITIQLLTLRFRFTRSISRTFGKVIDGKNTFSGLFFSLKSFFYIQHKSPSLWSANLLVLKGSQSAHDVKTTLYGRWNQRRTCNTTKYLYAILDKKSVPNLFNVLRPNCLTKLIYCSKRVLCICYRIALFLNYVIKQHLPRFGFIVMVIDSQMTFEMTA